ncbi:peptidoglycan-binding protein [candidate division CSSED10-310 bacterium]|uniref:Peptidoglycan-binding protein n=1 Tax=candidate division CSSED10-310 bacterium TaxID=2855610 RepID=A0ABV6Z5A0_UNCC1
MSTGNDIFKIALKHLNEEYEYGVVVPKDDKKYKGPWDCAEFTSWCVFQTSTILYGCLNNSVHPSRANAYTGAWASDAKNLGERVSMDSACLIPGAMLLRCPRRRFRNFLKSIFTGKKYNQEGHIAISDGKGGTVEAHSKNKGVVCDRVKGRRWDFGVLIPGIEYKRNSGIFPDYKLPVVYRLTYPYMHGETVKRMQKKLLKKGFDPKGKDGFYGPNTYKAVCDFQVNSGLVVDGEVGPETAKALGIRLTGA